MRRPVTDVDRQILIAKGAALHALNVGLMAAAIAFVPLFVTVATLFDTLPWSLGIVPGILLVAAVAIEGYSKALLERARNQSSATRPEDSTTTTSRPVATEVSA